MEYKKCGDITKVYDSKGNEFIVDTDQLDKVLQYTWQVSERGYVRTSSRKLHKMPLHRFLLGTDKQVDHINRNPRDNRLVNLRQCTTLENNLNRGVRKDSKTGYKGVTKSKGKYRARIQLNGKRITIGYYETAEEAAEKYQEMARKYFGEYAPYQIKI